MPSWSQRRRYQKTWQKDDVQAGYVRHARDDHHVHLELPWFVGRFQAAMIGA